MKGSKLKKRVELATKNHRMRPAIHNKVMVMASETKVPIQHLIELAVTDFITKCENDEHYKHGITARIYSGLYEN